MNSIENFPDRVAARTGVHLNEMDLLVLQDGEGIPGHIFLSEGSNYVVGVGYPTETEDGEISYEEFLHCVIVEDKDDVYDDVRHSSGPEEIYYTETLQGLHKIYKDEKENLVFPYVVKKGDIVAFIECNKDDKIRKLEAEVKRLRDLLDRGLTDI